MGVCQRETRFTGPREAFKCSRTAHRVETPHPRAAGKQLAERLDGRLLESVEAVGKNLLLRFEGGLVLRSHLRMTGRWRVEPRGSTRVGLPWLVLRGDEHEAVLWNGPVLELGRGSSFSSRLGPDILAQPFDLETMLERLRATPQAREVGDALLDQRLVSGSQLLARRVAVGHPCRGAAARDVPRPRAGACSSRR